MDKKLSKSKKYLTRYGVRQLDSNIYLIDYKNDYDIDTILKEGMSSIGELIKFIATRSPFDEQDFSVGTAKGGGCSTFETRTPEGDHILGRNFDFKAAPCFVLWTHPSNHYASLSVIDGNFLTYGDTHNKFSKKHSAQILMAPYCCVDGINEKGLSIAVLQIKAKATKQTDPSKKNITTTTMIRGVLDTCRNVDEAVELIRKYNMHDSLFCCYHYHITDASGRSVVVEYIDNVLHVYERGSESCDVSGSVYEDDGLGFQYVTNYSVTKDIGSFEIEQHGEDRAEAMINALKDKNFVMTEEQAMDLLSHVRLDYDHPKYPWRIVALWSAVYNNNACTLKLAANTDYSRIYTFAVDKPGVVISQYAQEKSEYSRKEWGYL